jgi:hypothetical protein
MEFSLPQVLLMKHKTYVEARSRNNCYRVKAVLHILCVCVCVASVIQHAKRMHLCPKKAGNPCFIT